MQWIPWLWCRDQSAAETCQQAFNRLWRLRLDPGPMCGKNGGNRAGDSASAGTSCEPPTPFGALHLNDVSLLNALIANLSGCDYTVIT